MVGAGGGPGGGEAVLPASTCTLKAGSVACFRPSLTVIVMLPYVPTFAADGVPESCPLLALKVAHAGMLRMLNCNARPRESLAPGVKVYAWPAVTLAAGAPLMLSESCRRQCSPAAAGAVLMT